MSVRFECHRSVMRLETLRSMVYFSGVGAIGAALVACGPGPDGPADGGAADVGADVDSPTRDAAAPTPPAPPNIPWLEEGLPSIAEPMLTPCPEGWHAVMEESAGGEPGVVVCDPYGVEPAGGEPDVCPAGWAHFVGEDGCAPVGAPCPVGDFPEGLPTDVEVLHVLASAAPGGDGTEAAPLPSIAEAMALATAGTIVAIGKGVYRERVPVTGGVTLWGACAAETHLTASRPGPATPGVVTVTSADVHLTNLWIGPANLPGLIVIGAEASASIDGLVIDDVQDIGLLALEGGRVRGRELTVTSTRPDGSGFFGHGIMVQESGEVDVSRVVLSRNRLAGAYALEAGTSLTLSDVTIADTLARQSDGANGFGLHANLGATVTVSRALLSRNRALGALATGEGTTLALSDAVIRDTKAQDNDGTRGSGLIVTAGATATVARTLVSHHRIYGVYAELEGTALTLSDVVIRDTLGELASGADGIGLVAMSGARVELSRGVLSRSRKAAIHADGETTSLSLSDIIVHDTEAQESDGVGGRGLNVQGATVEVTRALLFHNLSTGMSVFGDTARVTASDLVVQGAAGPSGIGRGRGVEVNRGANLELRRAVISRNRGVGVAALGGASVTLSDAFIEDTRGRATDDALGVGLAAQAGSTMAVTRARLLRNHSVAIYANGEGVLLDLRDVVVEDTAAQESDGRGGRAIGAQAGATVNVTRARLSRNRDFGVIAANAGTTVRLLDVVVEQTASQVCGTTTCAGYPFGVGLASAIRATLTAERFEARDAVLCGVLVADAGEVDLLDGEVSGSEIGVCLQVDGYSIPRLTNRVRFLNNGTNLDATNLPVPSTAGSIDEAE